MSGGTRVVMVTPPAVNNSEAEDQIPTGTMSSPRTVESGGGRISPSDHFSQNINHLNEGKKARSCSRTMAILCSVLATVFLLTTIALAIVVGVEHSGKDENTKVYVVRPDDAEIQKLLQENGIELTSPLYSSPNKASFNQNNEKPLTPPNNSSENANTANADTAKASFDKEFELPPEEEELIPSTAEFIVGDQQQDAAIPVASESASRRSKLDWPLSSGSLYGHFRKAAVASDHGLCSEIGRDVMIEGGNAVDSVIATMLCIGVVNPQSSGLGGGFLMTLYNSTTGRCLSINARETAPAAAHKDMFINDTTESTAGPGYECHRDSCVGYRAIAIPSELHGFWTAYSRFGSGKVSWQRLFEPSAKLARDGFPVSSNLAMILSDKEKEIQAEETMREIFINAETGRVYEEGEIMKRETLAETLVTLANASNPLELFYRGGFAQTIATEIADKGGILTTADLQNYQTDVDENPIESDELPDSPWRSFSGDLAMCGPPPPSSFVVTQSIIATMAEFYAREGGDLDDPLVYHRFIEAMKFAYAKRTFLGDGKFVKESASLVANMTTRAYIKNIKKMIQDTAQDLQYYNGDETTQVPDHGTSHTSIVDSYGNAVSLTSTVNLYFGAMRASPTLGIIWNNEMDDFSTPGQSNAFGFAPSESNYIAPGKRPMSSMSPMIVYDRNENQVRLVTGAAGGSFIISAVAQTVVRTLLFNQTVKEANDAPRLHNQYLPHTTQFEKDFPKSVIRTLESTYHQNMTIVPRIKSVVQALEVRADGFIHGNSDFRRATATYPAGF